MVRSVAPADKAWEAHGTALPPLDDPYIYPQAGPVDGAPARATVSPLAVTSVVAPIVLGPVGAVAAILFGWAAHHEIARAPERRSGRWLATLGMVLGMLMTCAWGAALAAATWSWKYHSIEPSASTPLLPPEPVPAVSPGATARAADPDPAPDESVPKETTLRQEGTIAVVDVGVSIATLAQELARQRAAAAPLAQTLIVMTTRDRCTPCRDMMSSLHDPLMQTALENVRLVRVNIEVFGEDLDGHKIPRDRIPGFFLLKLDLTPNDGIDGGEWDEDVAQNIAPVLGAFVRGRYSARRRPWQPLPLSGMHL